MTTWRAIRARVLTTFSLLALMSQVHPCHPVGNCLGTYLSMQVQDILRLAMHGAGCGYGGLSETQHYAEVKRPECLRVVEDGNHRATERCTTAAAATATATATAAHNLIVRTARTEGLREQVDIHPTHLHPEWHQWMDG